MRHLSIISSLLATEEKITKIAVIKLAALINLEGSSWSDLEL